MCRSCGEKDETVNHMISDYSKLAQKKYKTKHDLVGKVIHWNKRKKLNCICSNQSPSK